MQNLHGFLDLTQPLYPSLMLENCHSHPYQGCLFSLSIDGSCAHTREELLNSYHKLGSEFICQENGHFSIVLWDGAKNQLLLYRDRVGVKPCFYMLDGAKLAFASLPEDLFALTGTKPSLDVDALPELLAIGPARVPGYGLFQNVQELLPGQYLIFSPEGLQVHTYWSLEAKLHEENYEDTCAYVAHLLEDSIGMQLSEASVPCSLLSGGIDSSIVTAIASKHPAFTDTPLSSFSFDFTGNTTYFAPSSFQPEQDASYIAKMLQAYPLNHTPLECSPTQLATLLPQAMKARNYPGMADIDASLLYFCSRIASTHHAALTGECADEIFGGYPWYYKPELFQLDQFPWSWDFGSRCNFLNPDLFPKQRLEEYAHHYFTTTMREAPIISEESMVATRHRQLTYLNLHWFMQTLLERMDRMGRFCGLEGKVPFADHRILEYLYNVPWEMKYKNGIEKALLRDAFKTLLPLEILHRKKSPYPKTYHPDYDAAIIQLFLQLIQDPTAPIQHLIHPAAAFEFVQNYKSMGRPWYGQLMTGIQLIAYFIQINDWLLEYHLL